MLSFPSGRLRFCLFSWYIRRVIRGPLYVAMMTVQSTSFRCPVPVKAGFPGLGAVQFQRRTALPCESRSAGRRT